MQTVTVERHDLIALIKLAQTEDSDWEDEYDKILGEICKKHNNIHIPPPVIDI